LQHAVLYGRFSIWLILQLSGYKVTQVTPTIIKGQASVDITIVNMKNPNTKMLEQKLTEHPMSGDDQTNPIKIGPCHWNSAVRSIAAGDSPAGSSSEARSNVVGTNNNEISLKVLETIHL
jgi:hypothetical protein